MAPGALGSAVDVEDEGDRPLRISWPEDEALDLPAVRPGERDVLRGYRLCFGQEVGVGVRELCQLAAGRREGEQVEGLRGRAGEAEECRTVWRDGDRRYVAHGRSDAAHGPASHFNGVDGGIEVIGRDEVDRIAVWGPDRRRVGWPLIVRLDGGLRLVELRRDIPDFSTLGRDGVDVDAPEGIRHGAAIERDGLCIGRPGEPCDHVRAVGQAV